MTAKTKLEVRKDGKNRFWVVPKDGGAEHGPFDTKKQAQQAKAALAKGEPVPAPTEGKPKGKKAAGKKKAAKPPKEKKLSAIDAAAQVLSGSKEPMNCKALVEAMATKGLWTSPGGKTPHATLYSAIIREIAIKGKESRFVKADRGQFAAK